MESGSVTTATSDQESGLRPTYRALAGNGTDEIGVLVLRDGARLPLWRVLPEDVRRIGALLERLTPSEREEVARSLRLSPGELPAYIEGLAAEDRDEALLVEDEGAGDEVVAFVGYRVVESGTAAMTLAVAPRWRDRGIARLLLDRTAVLAAHRGLEKLTGTASPENRSLVDLFGGAGFEVRETAEGDRVTMFTSLRSLSPEARHRPADG
ncbi:MAG: N-acetyltransferase family protein, partial [Gemmatimonadota bacterium]